MRVLRHVFGLAAFSLGMLGAAPTLSLEGSAVIQNEPDRGDLPDRDLPDRDLPDRDLPDRDLPDGDLPDQDLPGGDPSDDGDLGDEDLPGGGEARR
jgi:hypothetical protein